MCPQMEEIKVSPDYNWFRSTVPLKKVSTVISELSWYSIITGPVGLYRTRTTLVQVIMIIKWSFEVLVFGIESTEKRSLLSLSCSMISFCMKKD